MIGELKEGVSQASIQVSHEVNSVRPQGMVPKLTCPSFDGNHPR